MAFTQQQYETLTEAIAQGALSVKYGDKEVIFRSQKEMFELQNKMAVELGIISSSGSRRYGEFSKGL